MQVTRSAAACPDGGLGSSRRVPSQSSSHRTLDTLPTYTEPKKGGARQSSLASDDRREGTQMDTERDIVIVVEDEPLRDHPDI